MGPIEGVAESPTAATFNGNPKSSKHKAARNLGCGFCAGGLTDKRDFLKRWCNLVFLYAEPRQTWVEYDLV